LDEAVSLSALKACQAGLAAAKQELKEGRAMLWQYLEQKTSLSDTAADYDESVSLTQLNALIDLIMGKHPVCRKLSQKNGKTRKLQCWQA
jgi:hypothetical protein